MDLSFQLVYPIVFRMHTDWVQFGTKPFAMRCIMTWYVNKIFQMIMEEVNVGSFWIGLLTQT